MNFHRDFSKILRPYRTEWTVFHEEARIAGSIDMVYEVIEPNADTDTTTDTTDTTDTTASFYSAHHRPNIVLLRHAMLHLGRRHLIYCEPLTDHERPVHTSDCWKRERFLQGFIMWRERQYRNFRRPRLPTIFSLF